MTLDFRLAFVYPSAMEFFIAASAEHQRREKQKARELRSSQWWKNQLGRATCHHCEKRFHPSELTMDHLVPVARGGTSTKGNVVPACKPCNTQKGYKTALDSAFEEIKIHPVCPQDNHLPLVSEDEGGFIEDGLPSL
jgi:5-methylcytosine-specific restriction protein A